MAVPALILIVAALMALYVAWMNGVFLRCPNCGRIGSWGFDPVKPAVEKKDEDGIVQRSARVLICRKCEGRVLDKWSDRTGRRFERL